MSCKLKSLVGKCCFVVFQVVNDERVKEGQPAKNVKKSGVDELVPDSYSNIHTVTIPYVQRIPEDCIDSQRKVSVCRNKVLIMCTTSRHHHLPPFK